MYIWGKSHTGREGASEGRDNPIKGCKTLLGETPSKDSLDEIKTGHEKDFQHTPGDAPKNLPSRNGRGKSSLFVSGIVGEIKNDPAWDLSQEGELW